jgi:hypothetical protein
MAVDYQINLSDYIAMCINKDKPQLHCDGQCVLMKKIREKEKEETKKNLVIYEYGVHYVHKEQTAFNMYQPNEEFIEKAFYPYLIDYRFNYNSPIFRPPTV